VAKKKVGRPSQITKKVCDKVCNLIIEGNSVRSICEMEDMPHRQTLISWLARDQEFSYQYAQALEARTHFKAEERHQILDEAMTDIMTLPEGVNANVYANLVKERIRAIEWDAERLAAKRYKVKDLDRNQGEAQPMNITFEVAQPVKEVRTTNAKT
jgi:hypothetical protein